MSLDQKLLDKFDTLATKIQRRGYLLTEIYTKLAAVNLALQLANVINSTSYLWLALPLVGGVWGIHLWGTIKWANANRDYPLSARMMERLNADSLRRRETERWLRRYWLIAIAVFVPSDLLSIFWLQTSIVRDITDIVVWVVIFAMWYIHGCFYLGPGHFGKEKQETHSEVFQGANGR